MKGRKHSPEAKKRMSEAHKGAKFSEEHREAISKSLRLPQGEAAFGEIYANYKYQAKIRGIIFKLTKEQFRELITQNCAYCGIEPNQCQKYKHGDFIYNGVDRMNRNKGYTADNSIPACIQCNRAKNKYSFIEFLAWIKRVYQHLYDED